MFGGVEDRKVYEGHRRSSGVPNKTPVGNPPPPLQEHILTHQTSRLLTSSLSLGVPVPDQPSVYEARRFLSFSF